MPAAVDQRAQLCAEPEVQAKCRDFHAGSERRAERLVWCHTACLQRATCPHLPEAIVGHRSLRLGLGLGGAGEGLAQPSSLLPLWAPPALLPLAYGGGEVGVVGGRKCAHNLSPTPRVCCLFTLCFSPQAWASGFEHRYWPRQAEGGWSGASLRSFS